MNKREKEVIQFQLEAEEDILAELEKQYQRALKDIDDKIKFLQTDELTQSRIYQIQYQQALKGQIEGIIEKLHSDSYTSIQQFLNSAYTDAFIATAYDLAGQGIPLIMPIDQNAAVKAIITDSKIKEDLYTSLGVDAKALKKSIRQEITRGIASGMHYQDIARNIQEASNAPLSRAKTIARTESHRIQQASTYDAQKAAKKRGADVVKQWDSTLDGRTRSTHRHLDGQIKEVEKPFEMDGKKAMFPGEFGDPAEDCNCRCVSLTRARWALDDDELKTLQKRAEYFGLTKEKANTFEEFQENYLQASKMATGMVRDNDWSGATPRTVSKEVKQEIVDYGASKNINVYNLSEFDGDPEILKAEIDAIDKMRSKYPVKSKITITVDGKMSDHDFASTTNATIRFNTKALRNRDVTEMNLIMADGYFASSSAEGIGIHEYMHIFVSEQGNKGLEIAKQAYYNISGKMLSDGEALEFLETNISGYATEYNGDIDRDVVKNSVKATKYTEIIPEVITKSETKGSEFITEFIRLLSKG